MGYYTYFTLTIERAPSEEFKLQAIAELRADSESAAYALDENGDGVETCKWYNHDDDMIAISARWPGFLFILFGDGEDSTDQWYKYYLGGKMQYCPGEMVFPEFNEEDMT